MTAGSVTRSVDTPLEGTAWALSQGATLPATGGADLVPLAVVLGLVGVLLRRVA